MDLSLSEAEADLVELCREFATKEIATRGPLAWEEAKCPTDLLREMGALGLMGILVAPASRLLRAISSPGRSSRT